MNKMNKIKSFRVGNTRDRARSKRATSRRVVRTVSNGSFSSQNTRAARVSFRTARSVPKKTNTLKTTPSLLAIRVPEADLFQGLDIPEETLTFSRLLSFADFDRLGAQMESQAGTLADARVVFKKTIFPEKVSQPSKDIVDFIYICVSSYVSFSDLVASLKAYFHEEEHFFWIDQFCVGEGGDAIKSRNIKNFIRSEFCKKILFFCSSPLLFEPKVTIDADFISKLSTVQYDEHFRLQMTRLFVAYSFPQPQTSGQIPPEIELLFPHHDNSVHSQHFMSNLLEVSSTDKFIHHLLKHVAYRELTHAGKHEVMFSLLRIIEQHVDELWIKYRKGSYAEQKKVMDIKFVLAKYYRKHLTMPNYALIHYREVHDWSVTQKQVPRVEKLTIELNLAGTYADCGIFIEAEKHYQGMMDVLNVIFADRPSNPTSLKQLIYIGYMKTERTALDDARDNFQQALDMSEDLESEISSDQVLLHKAQCYLGLGECAREEWDFETAENYLVESKESFEKASKGTGSLDTNYTKVCTSLAKLYERKNDVKKCLGVLKLINVNSVLHSLEYEIHFKVKDVENRLSQACQSVQKRDPFARRIATRKVFHLYATHLIRKSNLASAAEYLVPLLQKKKSSVTFGERIEWMSDISRMQIENDMLEKGLAFILKQESLIVSCYGKESAKYALCLWNQAVILQKLGKMEESENKWKKALEVYRINLEEFTHEQVRRCAEWWEVVNS